MSTSRPTSRRSGCRRSSRAFDWYDGIPLLDGALAHLVCRFVDVHPAGDHVLWIGEVEHVRHRDGEPLLFYTGRFGSLRALPDEGKREVR
jgi:flavin reductase (DIM6/NTAB) family NADH-FMN oxidoreductase RutF